MRIFDAAFAGDSVAMRDHTGVEAPLEVARWAGQASEVDHALFVHQCTGPTIDLGCGPGRLVRALLGRGVSAMGVDSSAEAVRLARTDGLPVLQRSIFEPLPREGQWAHALLADGNIGIGGQPSRLLHRAWAILATGGRLHVELSAPGAGVVSGWRQLRVDGQLGQRFPWAVVSIDAVADLAARTGFAQIGSVAQHGRHVAVLAKVSS